MDAYLVETFIKAINNVFDSYELGKVTRMEDTNNPNNSTKFDITIAIGTSGGLKANFAISMHNEIALKIASGMFGMEMEELDDSALGALNELCNMTCGNAAMSLNKKGEKIDLTSPLIINGHNLKIVTSNMKYEFINLSLEFGIMQMYLAVEEK